MGLIRMLTPLETMSLIVLCLLLLLVVGNTLIPVAWAESADPAAPSEEDSVVVLPTLVVLFTQSDLKTATQQDIAAFHGQMAAIKEFFIQEGGQHIELELDYLQIDRPLALAEFGSPGDGRYHLYGNNALPFLRQSGIDLTYYPIIIAFWPWRAPNEFGATKAYGGAAEGPFRYLYGTYNSQGVFDGDYQVISRVGIHETLHNMDALLHHSGVERFWHADHMATLMPELLSEIPGAFLPRFTDEEMLELAEKEKNRQYSFPWQDQMVFYRQMMRRTTPEEWRALNWGYRKPLEELNRITNDYYLEPLYNNMWVPADDPVYVPVVLRDHAGRPVTTATVTLEDITLSYEPYTHTDGPLVLYENGLYCGWVDPGVEGTLSIQAQFGDQHLNSQVTIHRQRRIMLQAPARVEWTMDAEPMGKIPVTVTWEHLPLDQVILEELPTDYVLSASWQGAPLEVEPVEGHRFNVLVTPDLVEKPTSLEITLEVESPLGYDQRPVIVDSKVSWSMRVRPVRGEVGQPTEIEVLVLAGGRPSSEEFELWGETADGQRLTFVQRSTGRYVASWTPQIAGTVAMKVHARKANTTYYTTEEFTVEVQ